MRSLAAGGLALLLLLAGASARLLDEQAAVKQLVAKAKATGGYKNTKPLIGILSQPCHECPGRYGGARKTCRGAIARARAHRRAAARAGLTSPPATSSG